MSSICTRCRRSNRNKMWGMLAACGGLLTRPFEKHQHRATTGAQRNNKPPQKALPNRRDRLLSDEGIHPALHAVVEIDRSPRGFPGFAPRIVREALPAVLAQ